MHALTHQNTTTNSTADAFRNALLDIAVTGAAVPGAARPAIAYADREDYVSAIRVLFEAGRITMEQASRFLEQDSFIMYGVLVLFREEEAPAVAPTPADPVELGGLV